jgi:hypothetical protein
MSARTAADQSSQESPERVKVSFNLPVGELEAVRALANRRGSSVTDTLRRAIALELLADEVASGGSKLLIEEPDGKMKEILLR